MSTKGKKISPKGYQELNDRGIVAVRFPPGQGRAELPTKRRQLQKGRKEQAS